MKKLLIMGMIFLVMVCSVFAQGGSSENIKASINGKEIDFSVPTGLEKSMVRVMNTEANAEALQRMEKNLNQFREKHQEKLGVCEENCMMQLNEDADGNTMVKTIKEAKLFGRFSVPITEEFVVDSEGNIEKQSQNTFKFLSRFGIVSEE